jgi:hypothetical protein
MLSFISSLIWTSNSTKLDDISLNPNSARLNKAGTESTHFSAQVKLRVFHGPTQNRPHPSSFTPPVMQIYPDAWKLFISKSLIAFVPLTRVQPPCLFHLERIRAISSESKSNSPSSKTAEASPCIYPHSLLPTNWKLPDSV